MVDSAAEATEDLIQQVVATYGRPRCWGRYLEDGYRAATPATAAEVQRIHAHGIGVLLICNSVASNNATSYAAGQAAAEGAIRDALALGAPAGAYLGVDLEAGWQLAPDVLGGWADGVRPSQFAGSGFVYGNLQGNLGAVVPQAMQQYANAGRLIFWDANWTATPAQFQGGSLPTWNGYPGAGTVIWQACNAGPIDLGVIRLPLPGPGGLWEPSGPSALAGARTLAQGLVDALGQMS